MGLVKENAVRLGWLQVALLWTLPLVATENPPSVTTREGDYLLQLQVDAQSRSIAETFLLTLTIDTPIHARLLSINGPTAREDGVRIEQLATAPPRAIASDRLQHEARFRIYPYLPGALLIKGFNAVFQQDNQRIDVSFGELPLQVTSLLEVDPEAAELADWVSYPEAEPLRRSRSWWFAAGLLIAMILIVALALLKQRRSKAKQHRKGGGDPSPD